MHREKTNAQREKKNKGKKVIKSQHVIQWSINKQNHFAWLMAADSSMVAIAGWPFLKLYKQTLHILIWLGQSVS